jgi:bifunctional DNase/RNase
MAGLQRAAGLVLVGMLFATPGCTGSIVAAPAEHSMHVKSVQIDPRTHTPVVLLQEDEGDHRSLLIWIGIYEAQSIALGLDKVEGPRPNTHDLIKNLLDGVRGTIQRVVITELRNGTYFAEIVVEFSGQQVRIDSRPSDAIAVSLRTGTPVFATDDVLDSSETDAESVRALEILLSPGELERSREPARSF